MVSCIVAVSRIKASLDSIREACVSVMRRNTEECSIFIYVWAFLIDLTLHSRHATIYLLE